MKKGSMKASVLAVVLMLVLLVGTVSADQVVEDFEGGLPATWTVSAGGVAGTDVTATNIAPTSGSRYAYITSNAATTSMGAWGGNNGTVLTSDLFALTPDDVLHMDLQALGDDYVAWPDRAIVELLDSGGGVYATLFTASVSDNNLQAVPCTNCGYSISPGVTLTPATANWGPTTQDAGPIGGQIYGDGSGNSVGSTGWVSVAYSPADAGDYQLRFIVANYSDTALDLALAIDNIYTEGPTAIDLLSFTAAAEDSAILVEWETASELDNLGFNLYRSESADGERLQLNEDLIPSQSPGSLVGAAYSWLDEAVTPGVIYYYWLEDVDVYGLTTLHGPAAAQVAPRLKLRRIAPQVQPLAPAAEPQVQPLAPERGRP